MTVDLTVPEVHLHIGGEARTSGSGGVHYHVYPATGEVQGPVPLAGPDDVDAAVHAAEAAYPAWRAWRPSERARVLRRLGELMERDADEIARLSVLDNGMTAGMSQPLVGIMANWTAYYAGWADKVEGRVTSFPANQRELAYSMPEPYGVVGIILTWNGPVVSVGMKLIPALAAGNAVVMKPSELTPYATEHVMRLVREAGSRTASSISCWAAPRPATHSYATRLSRKSASPAARQPRAESSRRVRNSSSPLSSNSAASRPISFFPTRTWTWPWPSTPSASWAHWPGRAARSRRACSFTATSTTPSWSASLDGRRHAVW